MVLDEEFGELGWWGSRPDPLKAWVRTDGQALDRGARYREIRRWYARDRGRTTLEEIIGMVERTTLQAA